MFNNGYTGLLYLACSDKGKILGYAGPTNDWYNKEKNIIDFTYQNKGKQYWSLIGQCFADDSTHKFTKVSFNRSTTILSIDTPHIIETYRNGTSWYRVYSDGWCEQGGLVNNGASGNGSLVAYATLLKPYKDTNYMGLANGQYNGGSSWTGYKINPISGSQIQLATWVNGSSTMQNMVWVTWGYIS